MALRPILNPFQDYDLLAIRNQDTIIGDNTLKSTWANFIVRITTAMFDSASYMDNTKRV